MFSVYRNPEEYRISGLKIVSAGRNLGFLKLQCKGGLLPPVACGSVGSVFPNILIFQQMPKYGLPCSSSCWIASSTWDPLVSVTADWIRDRCLPLRDAAHHRQAGDFCGPGWRWTGTDYCLRKFDSWHKGNLPVGSRAERSRHRDWSQIMLIAEHLTQGHILLELRSSEWLRI